MLKLSLIQKKLFFGIVWEFLNFSKILGIIAKDFHSVAYRQYSVYAWGTNGGQFGVLANIDTTVPTKAN